MGIKPPKGVILYGPPGTGVLLMRSALSLTSCQEEALYTVTHYSTPCTVFIYICVCVCVCVCVFIHSTTHSNTTQYNILSKFTNACVLYIPLTHSRRKEK